MARQIIFRSKIKKATGIALDAWATGLRSIAKDVKQEVIELISTPYPPASRPFKPPHSRRGSRGLMGDITVTVEKGVRGRAAAIVVKTGKVYGPYLEFGTSKMSPRPYARAVLMAGGRRGGKLKKKWSDRIARKARAKAGTATRKRR